MEFHGLQRDRDLRISERPHRGPRRRPRENVGQHHDPHRRQFGGRPRGQPPPDRHRPRDRRGHRDRGRGLPPSATAPATASAVRLAPRIDREPGAFLGRGPIHSARDAALRHRRARSDRNPLADLRPRAADRPRPRRRSRGMGRRLSRRDDGRREPEDAHPRGGEPDADRVVCDRGEPERHRGSGSATPRFRRGTLDARRHGRRVPPRVGAGYRGMCARVRHRRARGRHEGIAGPLDRGDGLRTRTEGPDPLADRREARRRDRRHRRPRPRGTCGETPGAADRPSVGRADRIAAAVSEDCRGPVPLRVRGGDELHGSLGRIGREPRAAGLDDSPFVPDRVRCASVVPRPHPIAAGGREGCRVILRRRLRTPRYGPGGRDRVAARALAHNGASRSAPHRDREGRHLRRERLDYENREGTSPGEGLGTLPFFRDSVTYSQSILPREGQCTGTMISEKEVLDVREPPGRAMGKIAELWKPVEGTNKIMCTACARYCKIGEGQVGLCGIRGVQEGKLWLYVYGRVITGHVDPIEQKPVSHYRPVSEIFSIATTGCNWLCHPAGTLILLHDGSTKPVEEVREGDALWSVTNLNGRTAPAIVTASGFRKAPVFRVVVEGRRDPLLGTAEHPVFTLRGWKSISRLQDEDHVLVRKGSLRWNGATRPRRIPDHGFTVHPEKIAAYLDLTARKDLIAPAFQWSKVLGVFPESGLERVYSFECIPFHNYVAQDVIVHNCRYCFVPGTEVMTNRGHERIEDLFASSIPTGNSEIHEVQNRTAFTHRRRWRRIAKAFEHLYSGPILEFRLAGAENIECTPDHHVFASINESPV